jgi:MFS family permease
MKKSLSKPTRSAWLVFFFSACFLFYKYILQVSPSVMSSELMSTYSLSGTTLGFLVGFYFYTYLIMQIPSGILLDHYGPRKVTTFAIFLCACGILIFSQTSSFAIACVARLMIGFGAAFATTSYMKLSNSWFPTQYFSLLSGLFGAACMTGAGTAQAPLAWLIRLSSWRHALVLCAIAGFILCILFFLLVRDYPKQTQSLNLQAEGRFTWTGFIQLFKKASNWPLLLYGGLAFTPVSVFGGLWGAPYLMAAYHLTKTTAASSVSLVFFGFAIGGILTGFIGKAVKKQLPIMTIGTSLALVCLCLILYTSGLPLLLLNTLIFLLGFFTSSFLLTYAIARNINNLALVATVIGVINMGDPLCGGIAEPLIGKILDLHWNGQLVDNARVFSVHAYHLGLSTLSIYFILALICCAFIKEHHDV